MAGNGSGRSPCHDLASFDGGGEGASVRDARRASFWHARRACRGRVRSSSGFEELASAASGRRGAPSPCLFGARRMRGAPAGSFQRSHSASGNVSTRKGIRRAGASCHGWPRDTRSRTLVHGPGLWFDARPIVARSAFRTNDAGQRLGRSMRFGLRQRMAGHQREGDASLQARGHGCGADFVAGGVLGEGASCLWRAAMRADDPKALGCELLALREAMEGRSSSRRRSSPGKARGRLSSAERGVSTSCPRGCSSFANWPRSVTPVSSPRAPQRCRQCGSSRSHPRTRPSPSWPPSPAGRGTP